MQSFGTFTGDFGKIKQRMKSKNYFFSTLIATGLGAGFSPKAPGTAGTLVGWALRWATLNWSYPWQWALWSVLTVLGIWAAQQYDEQHHSRDHSRIVIDEVLGFAIASASCTTHMQFALAFLLFRFFDIVKPPPISALDRLSKNQPNPNGLSVILDDAMAGLISWLILKLLVTG